MQSFIQKVAKRGGVAAITCAMLGWFSVEGVAQDRQDQEIARGEIGERIRLFVTKAHERLGFTGSVLAARDGEVVVAVSVGRINGPDSPPISTTTLFELGSTTKAITAVAVLRLQEAGKLKLDDPISRFIPDVPENCRAITVRHLLQHTSGIPGTNIDGAGTDLSKVLPLFFDGGPKHELGTRHEYWNQGYALLSEIIARASGRSYVDFCREEIFRPSGMATARFTGDEAPANINVATGTSTGLPPRTALEHPYGEYGFQYRGMGGVVANVWDLWRFDRSLAAHKLLTKESQTEMIAKPISGYALGWQVHPATDGKTCHGHDGGVRGFLSGFRRYPLVDGCLIVQTNRVSDESKWLFHTLKLGCEKLLLTKSLEAPIFNSLEPRLAAKTAGKFVDPQHGTITVTRDGGARIDWNRGQRTDGALALDEAWKLQFIDHSKKSLPVELATDELGEITSLKLLTMHFRRPAAAN